MTMAILGFFGGLLVGVAIGFALTVVLIFAGASLFDGVDV